MRRIKYRPLPREAAEPDSKPKSPRALSRARLRSLRFDFRTKLIALSLLSPAVAMVGALLTSYLRLNAGYSFACYMVGASLGMLVLVALVTRFLETHFFEFKGAKFFGLGLLALASYVAHGQAVGEINAIFGVDAASLPHATTAASAMWLVRWACTLLLWPICGVSFALSIYYFGREQKGNGFMAVAVFISAFLFTMLVSVQAADEERRKSNLYQIALDMDFNKRSNCLGVPEDAEGVVFIGPEQSRAIVAPRLVLNKKRSVSIFKGVEVPARFATVRCP